MGPSELIAVAGIAITVLMAVAGSVVGHYVKYLKKRERDLEKRVRDLLKEVEELKKHPTTDGKGIDALRLEAELKGANTDLRWNQERLAQVKQAAEQLATDLAATKDREASQRQALEQLHKEVGGLRGSLKQLEGDLAAEQRRVQRALGKSGQTWTEKVRYNAPDFKPLDPEGRRTPIVSILNLKGGVGKTTVTANLGAALDGLGYRVLLLDLDLQGSLTALFLTEGEQTRLFKEERLLEDFLFASFGAEYPSLVHYTHPILPDKKSGLVPTTDALAYAETDLTLRWLLREEGNKDPRFLLRRELQLKRINNKYDVILLDCPPLINVCCVNALGASDYLLIPVLPSRQATARVPVLLGRLKTFRENINPDLKVLGILFNRTHRSELTANELNRLTLLRDQCKDIWGEEVPQFETFIRQSPEVRAAEDEHRPLRPEDAMYVPFAELAREILDHLPNFCQSVGPSAATVEEVVQ